MLSAQDALAQILAESSPLPAERVPLQEAAFRVLCEDVASPRDLPPFDASQMDGYALRAADISSACESRPARLQVTSRIDAGATPSRAVGPGEAARIMTGAPLPPGADCVVMQEKTRADGEFVEIRTAAQPGDFVRRRGAEITSGGRALASGTPLGPAQLAFLASVGRSTVAVHQRPRVAILTTGDDLCSVDESPGQRIVDSNSYSLAALVASSGGIPVRLGIARDDRAEILGALRGAAHCEVVLTSAGVSVGERDFVREVLAELGVTERFWRVAIKPGKPLAFGTAGPRLFFGLPGNPTSSMVCFEQFVRPALRKLQGQPSPCRPRLRATLETPIVKAAGLTHFVRATTSVREGRLTARPVPRQDSGLVSSMAEANSLVVLEPQVERVEAGAEVTVELLDTFA
jgi:molybdopterin molybdotransferase